MSKPATCRISRTISGLIAITLALHSLTPTGLSRSVEQNAQAPNATPTPVVGSSSQSPLPRFIASPRRGTPGKKYDLVIRSTDRELKGVDLIPPEGSGIVKAEQSVSDDGSFLTTKIAIDADAPLANVELLLKKEGRLLSTVTFEVTVKLPSPIPPGLEPQVDIMWKVMPRDEVHNNFGHKIAGDYYGIELIVGNNSGYDLQISSIGFELLKDQSLDNEGITEPKVPSSSYRATRGTLERGQQLGRRVVALSIIQTLGPLATGFLPFFKQVNHRANYSEAVNIFSNPLEKGIEVVFPDTTVRQLIRLDEQMLKDGVIINNNTQIRTVVFFHKSFLNISKAAVATDPYINSRRDKDKIKDWRNDPRYVMHRLGNLVLIGNRVEYLNRVRVVSTPPPEVTPPPSILGMNPVSVAQGANKVAVVFSGTFLAKATVSSSETGLKIEDTAPDANGYSLSAKITVDDTVAPGEYTLVFNSPGGSTQWKLTVSQVAPAGLSILQQNGYPPTADPKKSQEVQITITGKHLERAELKPGDNAKGKVDVKSYTSVNGQKLTATITVLKEATAGKYDLVVKNAADKATTVQFEVK